MVKVSRAILLALAAVAFGAACTVHQTEAPALVGPSELALSLSVTASPDSLSQDGASQSAISASALDANGRPIVGLPMRLDMVVGGVLQDYGQLAARTIVTGSDGKAKTAYTAPPTPPASTGGAGTIVTILVTPTGSNFQASLTQSVDIRLVPPGVILPPADTPTAKFVYSPTAPAAYSAIRFDASSSCAGSTACTTSDGITSFSWTFGDGSTGTGQTASHSYSAAGSFIVTLTVINDRGVSASTTQTVTVGAAGKPTASFVYSPSPPTVGALVYFNASASTAAAGHTIATYAWDFGDGTTKSGQTTSHDFVAAGTYTVLLSVTDDVGQTGTMTQSVAVAAATGGGGGATTAAFVFSPTAPVVGQIVFFNASGSSAASGRTLTEYAWSFGDGTSFTDTGASTTHTFTTAGAWSVQVTVKDSTGQTARVTNTVTVSAAGTVAPTAGFTSSPSAPGVNQDVFFNASTSTAAVGHTLTGYAWAFGDGNTGTGVTATHAYARAGTFTVTLVVTDDANQTGTVTGSVTVAAASSQIVAEFVWSPTDPKITGGTNRVYFDATPSSSTAGITRYDWDYGNGTTAPNGGQKPNYLYANAGTWVVRLTVTDAAGRTATITHNITVGP